MSPKALKAQRSFTLLETIMALAILATFLVQVVSVQGRSVEFETFGRHQTQAGWLAAGVMAQIERGSKVYDFSTMSLDVREERFSDAMCSRDETTGDCPYTYSAKIETLHLPVLDLILSGLGGALGSDMVGGFAEALRAQLNQYLGTEPFRMATVEVAWPYGSRRETFELAYLIPDQHQLDRTLQTIRPLKSQPPPGGPAPAAGDKPPPAAGTQPPARDKT